MPLSIHAFGTDDVSSRAIATEHIPAMEVLAGTSLWKNAWRRLLRNRLAVFGMIVVALMILASLVGPAIIYSTTGFTYDFIPKDPALVKSFPPSWTHPMGTDIAGR